MIDVSSFFFFISDIHNAHGWFVWVSSDWCSPPRSCIAGNAGWRFWSPWHLRLITWRTTCPWLPQKDLLYFLNCVAFYFFWRSPFSFQPTGGKKHTVAEEFRYHPGLYTFVHKHFFNIKLNYCIRRAGLCSLQFLKFLSAAVDADINLQSLSIFVNNPEKKILLWLCFCLLSS